MDPVADNSSSAVQPMVKSEVHPLVAEEIVGGASSMVASFAV